MGSGLYPMPRARVRWLNVIVRCSCSSGRGAGFPCTDLPFSMVNVLGCHIAELPAGTPPEASSFSRRTGWVRFPWPKDLSPIVRPLRDGTWYVPARKAVSFIQWPSPKRRMGLDSASQSLNVPATQTVRAVGWKDLESNRHQSSPSVFGVAMMFALFHKYYGK